MHQRSRRASRPQKIYDNVERLRVQNRRCLEILSSRRRPRQDKDSRANNRADAERRQRPRPERLAQTVRRIVRFRYQLVDRFAAERLTA